MSGILTLEYHCNISSANDKGAIPTRLSGYFIWKSYSSHIVDFPDPVGQARHVGHLLYYVSMNGYHVWISDMVRLP